MKLMHNTNNSTQRRSHDKDSASQDSCTASHFTK